MENKQVMTMLDVLETIQQECKSNDNCSKCPYDSAICNNLPEKWKIDTLEYRLLQGGDTDGN